MAYSVVGEVPFVKIKSIRIDVDVGRVPRTVNTTSNNCVTSCFESSASIRSSSSPAAPLRSRVESFIHPRAFDSLNLLRPPWVDDDWSAVLQDLRTAVDGAGKFVRATTSINGPLTMADPGSAGIEMLDGFDHSITQ
jgi:hypothetical protein